MIPIALAGASYRSHERRGAHWHTVGGPCFKVYTTASLAESPSVTSGMRIMVQPANPASSIRFLREQLPKVYVFSAHKIFTIFCAPFPNTFSHFKVLAMP